MPIYNLMQPLWCHTGSCGTLIGSAEKGEGGRGGGGRGVRGQKSKERAGHENRKLG